MLAANAQVPRLHSGESSDGIGRLLRIEVQLFGDGKGQVVALGERDCSAQRGGNCLLAEAPAPRLDADVRRSMIRAAIAIAEAVEISIGGVNRVRLRSPATHVLRTGRSTTANRGTCIS